ncbi:unnamed protein product [Rotaria sp. Silwood2]|nr:unnamed protein product [Rotaria sp. Silwood2]
MENNPINVIPTSVHELRPSDIKCIAALCDSLTVGLEAHATTSIGLFMKNRNASWSISGDYTFNRILSLRNIIRQYDKALKVKLFMFLCQDLDKHSPSNFTKYETEILDYLHDNIPRALINLVLILNVRGVDLLNVGGPICRLFHNKTYLCAAFLSENQATKLNKWIPQYHEMLVDLIHSSRYDTNDNFTVVIQPFMVHAQ